MMPGLTPARQLPFVRQLGRDPHHHPGCVPEQVAVGGIMDIRLDDKAVAPARQPLAGVVVAKAVAVPHDQLVDVSQRVLVQQRDIPRYLVIGIRRRVELAVPEQLAQHQVRVGVFMKPVEIAAKSLLQHREHENRPQFHPRVVFRFESEWPSRIIPSGAEQTFPHSSSIVGSVLGLWMTAAAVRGKPFDGSLRTVPFASAHFRDLASCPVSDRFSSPRNTDFGASMAEKHRRIRAHRLLAAPK